MQTSVLLLPINNHPHGTYAFPLISLSIYPQVWNGRVRYVFGSPLVAEDMRLVHAEVADACFMLCSKVSKFSVYALREKFDVSFVPQTSIQRTAVFSPLYVRTSTDYVTPPHRPS